MVLEQDDVEVVGSEDPVLEGPLWLGPDFVGLGPGDGPGPGPGPGPGGTGSRGGSDGSLGSGSPPPTLGKLHPHPPGPMTTATVLLSGATTLAVIFDESDAYWVYCVGWKVSENAELPLVSITTVRLAVGVEVGVSKDPESVLEPEFELEPVLLVELGPLPELEALPGAGMMVELLDEDRIPDEAGLLGEPEPVGKVEPLPKAGFVVELLDKGEAPDEAVPLVEAVLLVEAVILVEAVLLTKVELVLRFKLSVEDGSSPKPPLDMVPL